MNVWPEGRADLGFYPTIAFDPSLLPRSGFTHETLNVSPACPKMLAKTSRSLGAVSPYDSKPAQRTSLGPAAWLPVCSTNPGGSRAINSELLVIGPVSGSSCREPHRDSRRYCNFMFRAPTRADHRR